ncbi:guanine nucleotide binding protein, alpha subunit [Coprinopsis sp. MPI-PUGE-AT-0042]|nr:guanine nucleotide binding protein, alpha subunit [Coprinopsis sp. MPI-PUGE-AT-0042]
MPSQVEKLATRAAVARNEEIDQEIKQDRRNMRNSIRILLLGTEDSGKDEILKQMKLLSLKQCTKQERASYKDTIGSILLQSMRSILHALPALSLSVEAANTAHQDLLLANPEDNRCTPDLLRAVGDLWRNDPSIQAAARQQPRRFHVHTSALYFLNALGRITQADYSPSDQDILEAQIDKTGINETKFKVGELTYKIIDMGTQTSERQKWLPAFEDVTALMFVVDMSAYDQMLHKDDSVNSMQAALGLFDSICNSRWQARTSIILFLNNVDVFQEKLSSQPLRDYFPDYSGDDFDSACDYLLHRFVSLNQSPATKQIYAHYTCVTSTEQVNFVLSAVKDILLQLCSRERDLP